MNADCRLMIAECRRNTHFRSTFWLVSRSFRQIGDRRVSEDPSHSFRMTAAPKTGRCPRLTRKVAQRRIRNRDKRPGKRLLTQCEGHRLDTGAPVILNECEGSLEVLHRHHRDSQPLIEWYWILGRLFSRITRLIARQSILNLAKTS